MADLYLFYRIDTKYLALSKIFEHIVKIYSAACKSALAFNQQSTKSEIFILRVQNQQYKSRRFFLWRIVTPGFTLIFLPGGLAFVPCLPLQLWHCGMPPSGFHSRWLQNTTVIRVSSIARSFYGICMVKAFFLFLSGV